MVAVTPTTVEVPSPSTSSIHEDISSPEIAREGSPQRSSSPPVGLSCCPDAPDLEILDSGVQLDRHLTPSENIPRKPSCSANGDA